jgi:hypothetical protein
MPSNGRIAMTSTTSLTSGTQLRDSVQTDSTSLTNTVNRYSFINLSAADPYMSGSGFSYIKVTYLNNGNPDALKVYVCEFSPLGSATPDMCVNTESGFLFPKDDLYSTGLSSQIYGVDPSKQQELILFNGASSPTRNIPVLIEAFDSDMVPMEIPSLGQTMVDVNASNSGVNRRIRTVIPKP